MYKCFTSFGFLVVKTFEKFEHSRNFVEFIKIIHSSFVYCWVKIVNFGIAFLKVVF